MTRALLSLLAFAGTTAFLGACDKGQALGTYSPLEIDSGARPGGETASAVERPLGRREVLLVLRLGGDHAGGEVEVLRRSRLHQRGSVPRGSVPRGSVPRGSVPRGFGASDSGGRRRRLGRRHRRWRGRYEVRSAEGAVLSRGRFRLPRRLHALFARVGGPAEAVDVELLRPVLWLRVDVPPGARSLVLYDAGAGRRLGEVRL